MTKDKRFRFNVNKYTIEEDGVFFANLNVIDAGRIVDKLNEQQATIEQQENEIEKLKVEKQMLEKVISNNLSDFKNGGWHRIRDLR